MAKHNSFKKLKIGGYGEDETFFAVTRFVLPFFLIFALVILLVIFLGAGSSAKLL